MGRDARVAASMLAEAKIDSLACPSLPELVDGLKRGAGFAIVTEEALRTADLHPLAAWIGQQPEWSDFPFILLTLRGGIERNPAAIRLLQTLGNVTFLERPFHPTTLVSLAQSAIRGRRRQYEARARLEALADLNETLEARVDAAVTQRLEDQEKLASAETALRQAQKMEAVGQLTGGVAHDFNNLLMVFSTGLFLLDQPMDAARRQRVVDGMRQAIDRGSALTRQLLAFSRRRPIASKTVDLRTQLLGMHELLQRSLRGDIEVEMAFDDGLWPVELDPGELELAVLNICVNARDAMPDGGKIRIDARNVASTGRPQAHDSVRLSISDTGVGMPKDVVGRAFEPFFTTKDVGKGSGLGLAQVYGFVKQSNGEAEIESAQGKGTTVILAFPRSANEVDESETAEAVPGAQSPRPAEARTRSRGDILFVEDDATVASLTTEMLKSAGYAVQHVKSASAALETLAQGRNFDIVLSDVMMPGGMSGADLAREICKRRPHLPVVLATGYIEAARTAMGEGMEVLMKPFHLDALAEILDTHISNNVARAR
ncbi:MAG TPA: ATP-binding protein [Steroidobacteraceae bacterium]|nr:ATP-binding protein [Steroidobacteraceae bacterium]